MEEKIGLFVCSELNRLWNVWTVLKKYFAIRFNSTLFLMNVAYRLFQKVREPYENRANVTRDVKNITYAIYLLRVGTIQHIDDRTIQQSNVLQITQYLH